MPQTMSSNPPALLTPIVALLLFGCASTPDSSGSSTGSPAGADPVLVATDGDEPVPVGTFIDARPAAMVDGRPVSWGELRPLLNELAGAAALEEIILDRRLEAALDDAGHVITSDLVDDEKRLLIEGLSDDDGRAVRLLESLRRREGLGPTRFVALLRRNAGLRRLVQPDVDVTPAAVGRTFELMYGEKRQARIMVLPTLREARAALEAVEGGETFADVATRVSTDVSAPRGGLLEPISRVDATYPDALRRALWALEPYDHSTPILLGSQYAIVMALGTVPGDDSKTLEDVYDEIKRITRLRQERLLMDRLARSLVSNVTIMVVDEGLHDSWRRARRRDAAVVLGDDS